MIEIGKTEEERAKEITTAELFQSFRMGWRDGAHDAAPAQRFVDHPTRADLTAMYLRGHAEGSKARRDALAAIVAELGYAPSILRGDDVRVPRTTEPVRPVRLVSYGEEMVRDVAVGLIYACPPDVPEKALAVEIDAFPNPPLTGPFRVRVGRKRPVLARPNPNPETGGRVLVFRMGYDLLTLAVGVALEPYK